MARTKKAATEATEVMEAVETKEVGIQLPEIAVKFLTVTLIGDSPLIVHNWSKKAKEEMLAKQMKQATKGKAAKDPERDFFESLYWIDGMPDNPTVEDLKTARFGFPAVAFKACAINAAYQQGILDRKTTMRGAFHIADEMVEIQGIPTMREDMVRVGGLSKTADIRYRAEFKVWRATLNIRYNSTSISPAMILNALNIGGFSNGIGEWRPEKDGTFGTFHVMTSAESK